ncbi:DUF2169 domain-containing protein [Burkholderia multivorans]|uniref:DUF2169 domain-containing protein n=1 Tax=Burkholderia multivorans TaxID=87883 RepID=UPI003D284F62
MVIDKGLRITGPRSFRKGWRGWKLGDPEPATAVPVRWEQAYGGTSRVALALGATGPSAELELNEVCFTNPLAGDGSRSVSSIGRPISRSSLRCVRHRFQDRCRRLPKFRRRR